MDAGKKKIAQKIGLTVGLAMTFAATGWAFLSYVEGWLGVVLWVLVAIPACFAVEFFMRPRTRRQRSSRSLPRMKVRTPVRGDPERQPTTRPSRDREFDWHREETPIQRRRRSYAGR